MTYSTFTRRVAIGVAAAAALALPAQAEVDMAGKTIEWTTPFSETGGSAKWANFFAPLLSDALPGNPAVSFREVHARSGLNQGR